MESFRRSLGAAWMLTPLGFELLGGGRLLYLTRSREKNEVGLRDRGFGRSGTSGPGK